jgi:hypothetical protein
LARSISGVTWDSISGSPISLLVTLNFILWAWKWISSALRLSLHIFSLALEYFEVNLTKNSAEENTEATGVVDLETRLSREVTFWGSPGIYKVWIRLVCWLMNTLVWKECWVSSVIFSFVDYYIRWFRIRQGNISKQGIPDIKFEILKECVKLRYLCFFRSSFSWFFTEYAKKITRDMNASVLGSIQMSVEADLNISIYPWNS